MDCYAAATLELILMTYIVYVKVDIITLQKINVILMERIMGQCVPNLALTSVTAVADGIYFEIT